jgi:glyoxylase-like metal-dependent hydrolase (beta-lactamase superfamily II)
MIFQNYVVGRLQANCYVVGDEQTQDVMIVDPGDNGAELVEQLKQNNWNVTWVLVTHAHLDHSGAVFDILSNFPKAIFAMHEVDYPLIGQQAPSASTWYGHEVSVPRAPDRYLVHGEKIQIGNLTEYEILFTPGHTPGHICIYGHSQVFTGDVLFQGSIGRSDFPGSNSEQLMNSIKEHLMTLPPDTVVHSGHGLETTIGNEIQFNPFLKSL